MGEIEELGHLESLGEYHQPLPEVLIPKEKPYSKPHSPNSRLKTCSCNKCKHEYLLHEFKSIKELIRGRLTVIMNERDRLLTEARICEDQIKELRRGLWDTFEIFDEMEIDKNGK